MIKLVDSHCHLDFKNFNKDMDSVLEDIKKNMAFVINVASDKKSNKKTVELTEKHDFIYGVLGIHPHDSKSLDEETFEYIEKNINKNKILAVGEIGLDYFKEYSPKEKQKEVFIKFLKLAKKHNKPVVIHSRDAFRDTIDILKKEDIKKVVFHCFSGNWKEAEEIISLGYYISFSGIISFSKDGILDEVVKKTPIDKFFIETDSPFLTPHPHRGKRNEPIYVKHVAEKIAQIKLLDYNSVVNNSYNNVIKFFGIIV